jgi:hypothetical protein
MMKRYLAKVSLGFAAGALFGVGMGWLDAWCELCADEGHAPWYQVFAVAGLPGDMIANQRLLDGADWQGGEAWECRCEIVLWNGLVWAVPATAAGLLIFYVPRPAKLASTPIA